MLRFAKKLGRTDDLLSLALILSLIRIDPDSYLGLGTHWSGNQFRNHISGDSLGYMQTDFHRRILPLIPDIPHLHHKSVEASLAQYQEELIADLNDLGQYGNNFTNNLNRTYAAYLLNEVGNDANRPSPQPPERINSTLSSTDPLSLEEQVLEEFLKSDDNSDSPVLPATDLTAEDVDLIEILWKQDIDLGVPRDVFAVASTSVEQHNNVSVNEKESYEEEALKKKKGDIPGKPVQKDDKTDTSMQNEDEPSSSNYIIDSETGEYILLESPREASSVPVSENPTSSRLSLGEALSLFEFDSEDFFEDKLTENDFSLGSVAPDTGNVSLPSVSPTAAVELDEIGMALGFFAPTGEGSVKSDAKDLDHEELNNLAETSIDSNEAAAIESMTEQLEATLEEMIQNLTPESPSTRLPLARSSSMEQRWNDIVSYFNLPTPDLAAAAAYDYTGAAVLSANAYHAAAVSSPVLDIGSSNGSYPNPALDSTLTLSSALSSSMNLTNSTDLVQSLGPQTLRNIPDLFYQANATDITSTGDGLFPSILNDEDLELMNLAMNDTMYSMRVMNANPSSAFGSSGNITIGATALASADSVSDSAVSSMGSERVPSISESDWIDTNVSDSNTDAAQSSSTYSMDFSSGSKYRPYEFGFTTGGTESGARNGPPVAQKKHHLFGRRSFQDSTPPNSGSESSLSNGISEPATPLTPATPSGKFDDYGAIGGSFHNEPAMLNEEAAVPGLENVRHNHTYTLRAENSVAQRPVARDKPKNTSSRSGSGASHNNSAGSENGYSRDEKRARALNIPISVEDIINLPIDEFTERIGKHELSDAQLSLIRDIRRRGKNKVAAQNCRKRKMDQIVNLADEVQKVRDTKLRLHREQELLVAEKTRLKNKFAQLYRHIFQALRDANGQPYSPSEFSLQQTADGTILLVPRSAPHGSTPIDPDISLGNMDSNSTNTALLGARRRTQSRK